MSDDLQRPGQLEFKYYVVAMIDVLGQSEKLRRLASIPITGNAASEFVQLIRETVGTVQSLRKAFEDFLLCAMRGVTPPGQLDESATASLKIINSFEPAKFHHFSDTMVFFSPVRNAEGLCTVEAVHAFLGACATVLAAALSCRIPIRGAIDVGLASECWSNEIYGCVLTQVHDLEQNLAQFPRVVVGEGLFGFLDHAEQTTTGNDLADRFRRAQVESCRNLIARDLDGAQFVDFMGREVRKIRAPVNGLNGQFQAAYNFVSQEHDRFIQAKNYKLAERYGRLRCYIASSL